VNCYVSESLFSETDARPNMFTAEKGFYDIHRESEVSLHPP
jgi:hypothetical protein